MAKNTIQFQKGLSLIKFQSTYATDSQCRDALFKIRWPKGFKCPECGHSEFYKISSRKLYECNKCHRQTSVTCGTIFDNTKLGLNVWFLAIYFMTQSKDGISSLNLARTIGVSANTALRVKHKLQHVMRQCVDSRTLTGFIQIDDAYMGGKRRGGKRGRGASGKIPIIAAVQTNQRGNPIFIKLNQVAAFSKSEISNWASNNLASGSIVVSDGLNCFSGVSDANCTHVPIVTGGGADSVDLPQFKWVNTVLGNVKNSIRGSYHSISQTHVARYLAEFCYRFNRRFILGKMIENLAFHSIKTPPVPCRILVQPETEW